MATIQATAEMSTGDIIADIALLNGRPKSDRKVRAPRRTALLPGTLPDSPDASRDLQYSVSELRKAVNACIARAYAWHKGATDISMPYSEKLPGTVAAFNTVWNARLKRLTADSSWRAACRTKGQREYLAALTIKARDAAYDVIRSWRILNAHAGRMHPHVTSPERVHPTERIALAPHPEIDRVHAERIKAGQRTGDLFRCHLCMERFPLAQAHVRTVTVSPTQWLDTADGRERITLRPSLVPVLRWEAPAGHRRKLRPVHSETVLKVAHKPSVQTYRLCARCNADNLYIPERREADRFIYHYLTYERGYSLAVRAQVRHAIRAFGGVTLYNAVQRAHDETVLIAWRHSTVACGDGLTFQRLTAGVPRERKAKRPQ